MKSDAKRAFSMLGLPLMVVFVATLGVVLVMQDRAVSSIQSVATSAPPAPAAQVAQFDPFATERAPTQLITRETNMVILRSTPARSAPPITYNAMAPVLFQPTIQYQSVQAQPVRTASGYLAQSVFATGSSSPSTGSTSINVPTATINVGTADINVSSSFRLFYGGKLVANGTN